MQCWFHAFGWKKMSSKSTFKGNSKKICKHFNNYFWECLVLTGTALPFVWGFFLVIYFERASSSKIYYHSVSGPCHYLWTLVLQNSVTSITYQF